jgi:hypothetical protein
MVMELVVGLVGAAAVAGCAFAWRLAQGPIDVTALLHRWQPHIQIAGGELAIGSASLAWEGFGASNQPLDIRVANVSLRAADGTVPARLDQARISLSLAQLLLGRAVPRDVTIGAAQLSLERSPQGGIGLRGIGGRSAAESVRPPSGPGPEAAPASLLQSVMAGPPAVALPPWMRQLRHLRIAAADIALHDPASGVDWRVPHGALDMHLPAGGGVAGSLHLDLSAGDIHSDLEAKADIRQGVTSLVLTASAVSPAMLARLSPEFAALAAADLPVGLTVQATLSPDLAPTAVRLDLAAGAGTVQAGRGSVALQSAAASILLRPGELQLDSAKIQFAGLPDTVAPPPLLSGSANATLTGHRVHAVFSLRIESLALADLGRYWPEGTGGGSRSWLVQNLTAGRAHDAHVEGSMDSPEDFSDPQVTALSGGLAADDVTMFWLRPIPPLVHGRARLTILGPDALQVTMDGAQQDRLMLARGSYIRITKLEERHQFGDIDVRLSGPLRDALAVLNHPRLNLLARSKMDMKDPSGDVDAHLTLHVPLEDRVTMDQIPIAADAVLTGVHLGGVAGGYDLDDARLHLKVDGDGLALAGQGDVAGIATELGLSLDFRAGPPDQVLQHITANGMATPAQLAAAGLPQTAVHLLDGGIAGLRLAYEARRNDSATLQLDADLGHAGLHTPLGWSKPAGPPASIGARVLLDHGHVAGLDHLHAEGPNLAITSRAQFDAGQPRALLLDRLDIGQTRAHGRIEFPAPGRTGYSVTLNGSLLDLSFTLAKPAKGGAPAQPEAEDATAGPAWSADLGFDTVQLAKAEALSPFLLQAASNGQHILHGRLRAGAPGQLAATISPVAAGRHLTIEAADAGLVLQALGVADNLRGGRLHLDGAYDDARAGAPLSGTATLTEFNLLAAPAIGRLLQAMTLYGLADVLRGPGLHFSKLVAPFGWQSRVLHLTNARAFSTSLGLTAAGDIDLRRRQADITGTIVPAYFFNQLLGDIPLIGKVFSPEKGGGVFAARYSVRGPLSDPKVGVNPLSALTPGFLREGFGLLGKAPAASR